MLKRRCGAPTVVRTLDKVRGVLTPEAADSCRESCGPAPRDCAHRWAGSWAFIGMSAAAFDTRGRVRAWLGRDEPARESLAGASWSAAFASTPSAA